MKYKIQSAQHTPGPLRVNNGPDHVFRWEVTTVVEDDEGRVAIQDVARFRKRADAEAFARAAPAMRDALADLLRACTELPFDHAERRASIDRARSVLKSTETQEVTRG